MAARQHGVVSIRQLLGPLGFSRRAVYRAAEGGRLHRLYRGVYAVGHPRISVHGRCLAAVLACGPGALLSHRSAAWLWDISNAGPAPFAVTVGMPRRAKQSPRLHFARNLSSEDRALREGVPVTALPRTLLDLAGVVSQIRLERALERAEERRLFDLRAVEAMLHRTVGHPAHGRLRRALALYRPAPYTRSGLERRFLELVEEARLPKPSTGFIELGYELDVYWPELRFGVELDAFETHGTRAAFERDRRRQEDLKLAGIEMTRFTALRIAQEPEEVKERLARLLAQRRAGPA